MPRVLYCLLTGLLLCLPAVTALALPGADSLNGPLLAASRTSVDEAAIGATDGPAAGDSSGKEAAAAEISGSRRPGVIDHLLQRPLPECRI